ncbi:unnamed protein product [Cochlearia groenlandica]
MTSVVTRGKDGLRSLVRFSVSTDTNADMLLQRLRKDVKWHGHLQRRVMQVSEQGMRSKEHCRVALEAFQESVDKVRLVTEKPS